MLGEAARFILSPCIFHEAEGKGGKCTFLLVAGGGMYPLQKREGGQCTFGRVEGS